MSFLNISAALDAHLNGMFDRPDVAWENKDFTPVQGTTYLRPTILPGETTQAELGTNGHDLNIGLYQIDVFSEAGTSKGEAIKISDRIADHFKRGSRLGYNGVTVRVESVSRGAAFTDGGWYQLPVIVNYIAYTAAR